jgi:hypothetical protein
MTAPRSLPILLALTLLFAQQAAQAHALSHLDPGSLKESISHTTLCAKCSTFGQLSSFVPSTASVAFEAPSSIALHTVVDSDSVRRTTTVFQSRAPPSIG